jgi:hypothetical protein
MLVRFIKSAQNLHTRFRLAQVIENKQFFLVSLLSGNDPSTHHWNLRMSWVYLVLAGLFEIGWPVGIKISQASETR